MLLWFDSLHYITATRLAQSYASATGWSVGAFHPQSGRKSIQTSNGQLRPPVSRGSGIGDDVVFVGYRLCIAAAPTTESDHLLVRTGGSVSLVSIKLAVDGTRVRFRVFTGDSKKLLMESSWLDVSGAPFLFLEWRIKLAVNGYLELRINGVRDTYAENVDTLNGSAFNWDHVLLTPSGTGSPVYRIADLYVADGTGEQNFIGPVDVSRMFPAKVEPRLGWAPSINIPTRKKLVLFAGQSNINGRGVRVPYTGAGKTPNSQVKIWDQDAQLWVDVTPGIGCNNTVKTWSFEMRFANLVSDLLDQVNEDGGQQTEVYLLRYGIDASYVYQLGGIYGPFTWDPDTPSNISEAFLTEVNNAVAALGGGGWADVDGVDIIWFQGETEAAGLGVGLAGLQSFVADTERVLENFETSIPVDVTFHRAVIQNIPSPSWANAYLAPIQNLQLTSQIRGNIIDSRDLVDFKPDLIHMGEDDVDTMAGRFFDSWVASNTFADYVKDDFLNDPSLDSLWIGSDMVGSKATFLQAPELLLDLMHRPVVAVNNKMRRSSSVGKSLEMRVGGVSLPSTLLDNSPEWAFRYQQIEGVFAPETLNGSLEFEIS